MTEKTQDRVLDLDLIPLSRFNDYYDYSLVSNLRYHNFYNTYGFNKKVVRKLGKRLYIKISALKEWIEETNGGNAA